ncbi:MAG TPA: sigma-70 family RNA polymerase sigma factor [Gemmata sp.]
MSLTRPADILRHLESTGAPDADLLARFAASHDPGAFEELVRRHGALVLGVCRRVTGHPQDAEDAFQAVFLVLAQKARGLRNAGALGNWLYGVAYRVSLRARRAAGRRKAREVTMSHPPERAAPVPGPLVPELAPVLDEELAALPAHYRDAIVLCDLQGASREDAARALGVPEGTLSSRLATGRKRLAQRLAKRGVALSVAAVPAALGDVRAATVVPAELVSQTGRLAADFATGGNAPRALTHLLKGGSPVRKTFLIGAAAVVAVAGAVLAAHPGAEPPPNNPPKPLPVAEKAPPPPKPQEAPKAAPAPAPTFTTAPKLRYSSDLPASHAYTALWNPTGTHLAINGREAPGAWAKNAHRAVVWVVGTDTKTRPLDAYPGDGATLVAVAPDGNGIVTDLREYKLISGKHRLNFWAKRAPGGVVIGAERPSALVVESAIQLEATETHGYAFSADRKTYRTVAYHRDGATIKQIEVVEVNVATGTAGKPLLKLDWGWHALSANGKRLAIVDAEIAKVTVYDVDGGAKVSEHTFAPDVPVTLPGGKKIDLHRPSSQGRLGATLVLSADGRRLVVARGIGRTVVLNTDTGDPLPTLAGTALGEVYPDAQAFTTDGRLLAVQMRPYEVRIEKARELKGGFGGAAPKEPQVSLTGGNPVLNVWDTQTGKALKTWQSADGVRSAFCPTKPLLAILEPNGDTETRLGFWDFAGEVEKK